MSIDQFEIPLAGGGRHVAERAVKAPFELIEAAIERCERRSRVGIGQRALDERGNLGKARLEPSRIAKGGLGRSRSRRFLARPRTRIGSCPWSWGRRRGTDVLVDAHQLFGRMGVPRLILAGSYRRRWWQRDAICCFPVLSLKGADAMR